jgi:hypothetical protein
MLELPALTTRMVAVTPSGLDRLFCHLAVAEQYGDGAGGHARPNVIGTRGQNDRHAGA